MSAARWVPSRTTGERLPWAASSSTWWKWEQNSTKVVARAGDSIPAGKYTLKVAGIDTGSKTVHLVLADAGGSPIDSEKDAEVTP